MKDLESAYILLKGGIITLNEFLEKLGLEAIPHPDMDKVLYSKDFIKEDE